MGGGAAIERSDYLRVTALFMMWRRELPMPKRDDATLCIEKEEDLCEK